MAGANHSTTRLAVRYVAHRRASGRLSAQTAKEHRGILLAFAAQMPNDPASSAG